MPFNVPFFIGGALGGALPDIDIDGSAIEKLGEKSGGAVAKMIDKVGKDGKGGTRILSKTAESAGKSIDFILLRPLSWLWRVTAEKLLGKIYMKIYNIGGKKKGGGPDAIGGGAGGGSGGGDGDGSGECLGKRLGWDPGDPWTHRGGLTHSLSFMLTSSVVFLPLSWLLGTWWLWAGVMLGILSHLLTDAMCVSGTKFFWPWRPKVGFAEERPGPDGQPQKGARGRDIRILPYRFCVHTGYASKSTTVLEQDARGDSAKYDRSLKWRRREKMWRYILAFLAVALTVLSIAGFGLAKGGVTLGFAETPLRPDLAQNTEADDDAVLYDAGPDGIPGTPDDVPVDAGSVDGGSGSGGGGGDGGSAAAGGEAVHEAGEDTETIADPALSVSVAGANPVEDVQAQQTNGGTTIPEHAGPTSLTLGDLGLDELPAGIAKMPDESLWVIGVGPVTKENLDNPKWVFTDEEKARLLAAAGAQRANQLPDIVGDLAQGAADAAGDAANEAGEAAEGAGNAIGNWLSSLFEGAGIDLGDGTGIFGFQGLTPYTDARK